MSTSGADLFLEALRKRVDATLDACTRCGDCVVACPMVEPAGLDPANAVAIAQGTLDLLAGGGGTRDAERWADVCTNSGKCIPACKHGVNPRFMVNMARVASREKLGADAVRRSAARFFSSMNRSTRVISRLLLAPEVLERLGPPLRDPEDYHGDPDIVFYTGCNIGKTPHIALLELLDAAAGGDTAHHFVLDLERIEHIEHEQGDVRRLADVAAGIETMSGSPW